MTFFDIKRIFRKLTPVQVAASELADAELERLEAHTGQEYATAMVSYQTARVTRLRAFLKAQG